MCGFGLGGAWNGLALPKLEMADRELAGPAAFLEKKISRVSNLGEIRFSRSEVHINADVIDVMLPTVNFLQRVPRIGPKI